MELFVFLKRFKVRNLENMEVPYQQISQPKTHLTCVISLYKTLFMYA